MKALDLLPHNEKAIVVFTRGAHLVIEDNGKASTGNWKLDPTKKLDKVILYVRPVASKIADVMIADHSGVELSNEEGRYVINLENLINVGSTVLNWKEFSGGGQNPIRYL